MKTNRPLIEKSEKIILGLILLCSTPGLIQTFMLSKHDLAEKFWLSGVWVIASFFVGSGIAGALSGLPKASVPINKVAAAISFGIAFLLIIIGVAINVGI